MDALLFLRHELVPALASALLHSLWQGALLAVAAAWTLRALSRGRAAWRHTVGMTFLAAMLLAPIVQFVRFTQDASSGRGDGWLAWLAPSSISELLGEALRNSPLLAPAVVLFWLAGAGVMLCRYVGGLGAVAAMERRSAHSLPADLRARVDGLQTAMGIARTVVVKVTDEVLTPCTARVLRPVIWFPLSLLTRASPRQLEALLAHELAHIARRDWLWNGAQRLMEALLFYHPAAWWLSRRIRQEREHACDDLAVAACGDPIALAEALAGLEKRRSSSALLIAAGGGSLLQRIRRLLANQPLRRRWVALAAVGALGTASVLLLTEIGMAGGRLPDLRVTASTPGELGPGDFREIAAHDDGLRRIYREELDAAGRRTETYTENGQARPIDAEVRRWISGITSAAVAVPETGPAAHQSATAIPEYRALVARVVVHPDVVALLGSPVIAAPQALDGNLRLGETDGGADLRIALSGPKGSATARVVAELEDGRWSIRRVQLR